MKIINMIKISIKLIVVGILVFSIIYPLTVGVFGQIWSNASRGNKVEYEGEIVGSHLIGQEFFGDRYFRSRPSSINYDAGNSGSANLAPYNPVLEERVEDSVQKIKEREIINDNQIPVDLITESGSALDPHVTPEAAYLQVPRIAENTGIETDKLNNIIEDNIIDKLWGLYGQKHVNVLELNLEIEEELKNE